MAGTTTTQLPNRLSPIHDELAHLNPTWGDVHGMPVALSLGDARGEADRARTLGIADVSALPRLTLKGPGAEAFLTQQGIAIPAGIFAATSFGDGLAARTGGAEFFIEDSIAGTKVLDLTKLVRKGVPNVYPVNRADASFLLSGKRATELFAQTCGYDFRTRELNKFVFTRVAGVSCSILPRTINSIDLFQLWMDGTFGMSLWETLIEITGELGGGPVGLLPFFPNLKPSSQA
jgi:sarcosine oxidase subunit gamma